MRITIDQTIALEIERCYQCGELFGFESRSGRGAPCPRCKQRYYDDLESECATLRKSNAALRGRLKAAR